MPFTAPNFANNSFGGHGGSARRPGAGIATWKVIQDMLEGPRTREAQIPKVGAVGQVLPEALNASAEPSKYEVSAAGEPYADAPTLTKTVTGLAPNENFETQYDAMSEQRAPSYAGRALRPQDHEAVTALQRAEAEYHEALRRSTTFGGQLMRGWSQDRINKAAAEVEYAKSKVESITPQRERFDNDLVQVNPDGTTKTLYKAPQKFSRGQALVEDGKEPTFPAGKFPEKEFTPGHAVGHEKDGREYVLWMDPNTQTTKREYTGGNIGPQREEKPPSLISVPGKKIDPKTGQPEVDRDGNPVMGWQGYDPRSYKPVPGAFIPDTAGKLQQGGQTAGVSTQKSHGARRIDEEGDPDPDKQAQRMQPGEYFSDPDNPKIKYLVIVGGDGKNHAMLVGKTNKAQSGPSKTPRQ
jgi:hypothetical protein